MERMPLDGTIVSRKSMLVHEEYRDQVTVERILYLVDGLKVVGFLAKPLAARVGQKFPVMIYNRGGFRSFSKIKDEALRRIAGYAARGYVVLATQYRGNDGGQGRDEYGGVDLKDVVALSWLAESLSEADVERMVMFGHSRGGMMTYLCIRHGMKLLAAAVTSAPTDLARRPLPHALEQLYGDLFGEPEENPTAYEERSALRWVEELRVPLLIQAGGVDKRVFPEESMELVERLQELGYEHKFILYPEGDHHLETVKEARDEAIFAWFEKYV
ncbi:S9 family peptidase [Tumebacillus sp. ITR2]|uniref:S9 family peptidase n=1 Tax=Tumebacillus amylolyticus TaxID=2801339 RepID=A0ABS1J831_9BACL|nr:alpha/beta fold hydrolase [Tumebacillus amylolyticus]MBL0386447.1 S9 family peptidase [Tumebacillus amylolyticus]